MDSDSSKWYENYIEDLSQGDIVKFIPYGLIEAPLIVCQPTTKNTSGKAIYFEYSQNRINRGKEYLHASFNSAMGIVVWPDCQIDKGKNQNRPENKWFAAVAPMIPLDKLDSSLHDGIKTFNRAQYFPLPGWEGRFPDSYVDLRHIWPMRYSLLKDRIATLSTAARKAFLFHRFWFDTSVQLKDQVQCPHCQNSLATLSLFQSKEPK